MKSGRIAAVALVAVLAGCSSSPNDRIPAVGSTGGTTPTCDVVGINGCTSKYATPATTTASPSPSQTGWTLCGIDPNSGLRPCDDVAGNCDLAQYSNLQGDLLDSMIENKFQFDETVLARDCPQFLPTWHRALTGFTDGVQIVGQDIQPGTYQTTAHLTGGRISDCYWERSRNGQIVANNFVSGASKVTVTVEKGDDAFTTRNCGDWVRL